jgi:hypothetical protein
MHGTCAASHWSDTGFTVSGADVASMMSTLSWVISCWATWAARESLDWLSAVTISTRYFFPPMVRPLANASRTFFSTNGFAVAKAASGPVIGLTKPILTVPAAELVEPLRPLLQPVTRPAPARPASPAKARRLSAGPACAVARRVLSSRRLTGLTSCAPLPAKQHRRTGGPRRCRRAPGYWRAVHWGVEA